MKCLIVNISTLVLALAGIEVSAQTIQSNLVNKIKLKIMPSETDFGSMQQQHDNDFLSNITLQVSSELPICFRRVILY